MSDKITVKAETITVESEIIVSHQCTCPNCEETIYSNHKDDWDTCEMVHSDQKIKCDECGCEFYVTSKFIC